MKSWRYIKTPFIAYRFWRCLWDHTGERVTWPEAWHIALGRVDSEVRR